MSIFLMGLSTLVAGAVAIVGGWLFTERTSDLVVSGTLCFAVCILICHLIWQKKNARPDDEQEPAKDHHEEGQDHDDLPGEAEVPSQLFQVNDNNALLLTDPATGLGNHIRFEEKFKNLVEFRSIDVDDQSSRFGVGVMNIDGMNLINDLYGESGGDVLIAQCASRLRTALDGSGFVYRRGGDEFAVVLSSVEDTEDVERIGKLLQEIMVAPFDINGAPVRITATFGFAIFPDSGSSFESISSSIETALFHSRRKGRGGLAVYSDAIAQRVREDAMLEQALRRAISEGQIKPFFQPIVSLQTGQLMGFESLARWNDPELGPVSPDRFITLAEERQVIAPLTELLLMQAAKTAAEWPEELFLSFNLSSAQLVDPTTAQTILDLIGKTGLPAKRLEIEVTETAIMSDPETASNILAELHENGIRISMDDFGTGQSSLGRLREMKLDKVKIDRAFVIALENDKSSQHIVRAILEMCAGLELIVVAEGIEDIGQAEKLREFGCHAGQGYLFGKPQDALHTMGYIREFIRATEADEQTMVA